MIGSDEAKEGLQVIVEFLKTPEKFEKFGGKFPKGVLISGPPGTFFVSSLLSSCTKSFSVYELRRELFFLIEFEIWVGLAVHE